MACRAVAIIRLDDRLVLSQCQGEPVDDASLWTDAVTKCAALNDKAIDRVAYSVRAHSVTVYAVAKKADGVGAIAIMSDAVGQRIGYLCCEKSLETFVKMFVERPSTLTAAACKPFDAPLKDLLAQFGDSSAVDERVAKVKRAVEDVREIAIENVERAIDRGERIESMVEQTEQLQDHARGFHAQSVALRRQMWWNRTRAQIAAGAVVVAFVFVVYVTFCGGLSCKSKPADQ